LGTPLYRTSEKEVAENRTAVEDRLASFGNWRGFQSASGVEKNTNAGFFHKASDRNGWGTGISKAHSRYYIKISTNLHGTIYIIDANFIGVEALRRSSKVIQMGE
jgi:hypothetical protein